MSKAIVSHEAFIRLAIFVGTFALMSLWE